MRQIPEARELECVRAHGEEQDSFVDKRLYLIEGQAGVWRRVHRGARGIKASLANAIVAHLPGDDSKLGEFVPWDFLHELLAECGMYFAAVAVQPPTDN